MLDKNVKLNVTPSLSPVSSAELVTQVQTNVEEISTLGYSLTVIYHQFVICSPFHDLLTDSM